MRVLGIETSADDTGIALIEAEGEFGPDFSYNVLANVVSSQAIHAQYGGIFPAMAKREHAQNLPIVLEQALREAKEDPARPNIDTIALTIGPGLEPCLWTAVTFVQELSKRWNIPVVPVNHMEGHILISMMEEGSASWRMAPFEFPALSLLISGGHTELILMKEFQHYEYLGRTRDDAVGEAFDKVARLLDLPYPGGPEISRLAEYARKENLKADFKLPRPMMKEDSYEFSFSGLKTAVERHVASHPLESLDREKIAREFEDTVTDVLVYKTLRAVEEHGAQAVIMGGGVSANKHIRKTLSEKLESVGAKLLVCPPQFSTDNGLMIALAGYFRAINKEFADPTSLKPNGNLKLC